MENKILFRASGNGALMTNKRGAVITEKQLITLNDYIDRIKKGGSLTPAQLIIFKDLKAKRDKPVELSDTAKSFVNGVWLFNTKGFWKDLNTAPIKKGLFGEEDAITLLSDVDDTIYFKNKIRKTVGNLTGECDINSIIDSKRVVQDTKCSWDPETFMNASMNDMEEWQGRTYMHLYDADEFWLRRCLIDCPAHLYEQQKWYLRRDFDIIDDEKPEFKPLFDQLDRNLLYSTNDQYTKKERVKTIKITRDDDLFQKLLDRIPAAVRYYKSIKLNMI